jgi:hypothetical protein
LLETNLCQNDRQFAAHLIRATDFGRSASFGQILTVRNGSVNAAKMLFFYVAYTIHKPAPSSAQRRILWKPKTGSELSR